MPVCLFTIRISGKIALYVNILSQEEFIMINYSKYLPKPKNKLEWVTFISGLVCVIFYSIRIISNYSILGYPLLKSNFRWIYLQPIEFIACILMVSGLIIEGIRKIRIHGFKLKSSINFFSGIVLLLIPLSASIFCTIWVPKMMDAFLISPTKLAEMELYLEKNDLNNERKALLSSIIASNKYITTGVITFIFDKNGNKIQYVPSDKDREIVQYIKEIRSFLPKFKTAAYIWVTVLLGSLLIGLKSPIETTERIE